MEQTVSGVGVVDKSFSILGMVSVAPCSLAELVDGTGLSRATAHRLAVALEVHGMLRRLDDGRFALGLHLVALGSAAAEQYPVAAAARPAMTELRDATGESVQLYVRDDDSRVCVAALESPHGLRTIVAVGAELPMDVGSAGRALSGERSRAGWVATAGEREPGVASVSAPVCDRSGRILAAVSISGPIERLGRAPGRQHGEAVVAAARQITAAYGA